MSACVLVSGADCEKNAFVSKYGFSKPTVMTKKGRPSERMTGSTGNDSIFALTSARRNANEDESRTHVPSQNLLGKWLIDT